MQCSVNQYNALRQHFSLTELVPDPLYYTLCGSIVVIVGELLYFSATGKLRSDHEKISWGGSFMGLVTFTLG